GFETIRYQVDDHLASIVLARPDKRNAMNETMFAELGEAVDMAGIDSAVRAVLVRGEGPSFCSGIDLALIGELAGLAANRPQDQAGTEPNENGQPSFALFV